MLGAWREKSGGRQAKERAVPIDQRMMHFFFCLTTGGSNAATIAYGEDQHKGSGSGYIRLEDVPRQTHSSDLAVSMRSIRRI